MTVAKILKDFNSLTGPWIGFSIQDGIRISERLLLVIVNGHVSGTGTDMDGKFEVDGFFLSRNQTLMLTRRYTWTAEPSQEGVGITYDYSGAWDGMVAHGHWSPRMLPAYGGDFEMWPEQELETIAEFTEISHQEPLALA